MRRVSVLGATGSIGQNTLDLIRRDQAHYNVVALTGGSNIAQLAADAIEFQADIAVTAHSDRLEDLRAALGGSGVEAAAGESALIEAVTRPADWVMSAIVGAAGLKPGWAALEQGATLALANKETMVAAGPLVKAHAEQHKAHIIPVDSEHSAIFQLMVEEDPWLIDRVIITASGGAFRDWPLEKLATATPAQAATHPNWDMGQRITIDSASMFNKSLELIEAKDLFGFSPDKIEVVIHPESIIHSMIGFVDGGIFAHLGPPDMRHAIGHALTWPMRAPLPVERLDLVKMGQLTFREPDPARYPALKLAYQVMETGGHAGAVFNAAKERALDHFIGGHIGFTEMAEVVDRVLDQLLSGPDAIDGPMTLDTVMQADHLARNAADKVVRDIKG